MKKKRIPIKNDTPENQERRRAENRRYSAESKQRWLQLSPEERVARKKEMNEKYKAKHPGEKIKWQRQWRREHPGEYSKYTSDSQEYRRRNKRNAVTYMGGKCVKCGGVFHESVYDFHHVDPTVKDVCVAYLMGRKFDGVKAELDKCILLCSNCHRLMHWEYRHQGATT